MISTELVELVGDFLKRVPLHTPFKLGQSIILQLNNSFLEVRKKKKEVQINPTTNSEKTLLLKFQDLESFKFLFSAQDLKEYGNRLVSIAVQGKIIMDPGPFQDPMRSGFHRFIGYLKKTKGLHTYACTIPTF